MAVSNGGACLKTSFVQGPPPQMQGRQMPHPDISSPGINLAMNNGGARPKTSFGRGP